MSEALITQMRDLAEKAKAAASTDAYEHFLGQLGTIVLANLDRIAAAFDSAALPDDGISAQPAPKIGAQGKSFFSPLTIECPADPCAKLSHPPLSQVETKGTDTSGLPEALKIQKKISDIYAAHLLQIRVATNDPVAKALVNRAFDSVTGMSMTTPEKGAA